MNTPIMIRAGDRMQEKKPQKHTDQLKRITINRVVKVGNEMRAFYQVDPDQGYLLKDGFCLDGIQGDISLKNLKKEFRKV